MQNIDELRLQMSQKKSVWIWIIGIVLVVAFILFITNSYLIIRQLVGNDLIISLTADKENLFLGHNEIENITFSILSTTNPFCKTECTSEFIDLSDNITIEKLDFNVTPSKIVPISYQFSSDKLGVGQALYRFNVECKSKETALCRTDGIAKKRSMLITLNYDLNSEEKIFKNSSKIRIIDFISKVNYMNYESMKAGYALNNAAIDFGNLSLKSVNQKIANYVEQGSYLKILWENYDYDLLKNELSKDSGINQTAIELDYINNSVLSSVSEYNILASNLSSIKQTISGFKNASVSNSTSIQIDSLIKDFNSALVLFANKSRISDKRILVQDIKNKTDYVSGKISEEKDMNFTFSAAEQIKDANLTITLPASEYKPSEIIFNERNARCCIYEKCYDCCETCSNENYPIIFLHGHDFNKAVSAEHSLDTFQKMQDKLEENGYLSAGSLILEAHDASQKNIWGKMNYSISVKTSYYFDLFQESGKERVIEAKTENLESYALRLKDIIELMKLKTGKDKVVIISHSMGGLVSRKYLQIFGNSSIDKLIMIGTPNHGVDGSISQYCSLLGAGLECRDMDKNSLFINKLNNEKQNANLYNIIGIGCNMDNEQGDGVVKNSSAYLDYAKNYYIQGKCSTLGYLHSRLVKPEEYPEAYEKIAEILKVN